MRALHRLQKQHRHLSSYEQAHNQKQQHALRTGYRDDPCGLREAALERRRCLYTDTDRRTRVRVRNTLSQYIDTGHIVRS